MASAVLEQLREAYEAERQDLARPEPEISEHERYLLVLLSPDHCDRLNPYPYTREDAGLVLHYDGMWEENVAWISEAERSVGDECGYPVHAVERHEDGLYYWTFAPKDA